MSMLGEMKSDHILEITHSDPPSLISGFMNEGIVFCGIESVDDLTITVRIHAKNYEKAALYLDRIACNYRILRAPGKYRRFSGLLTRKILLIGLLLVVFLTIYIPSRILFVFVEGNETISSKYITECANACGIRFGASRELVRSEQMKNQLLEAIPQLQWAGITTSGCVAKIQVKEKEQVSIPTEQYDTGNIVADRDGIIYSCVVERGRPLCKPGQAIQKGQTLVSAYTDTGLGVTYSNVQAEIYALTQRSLTAICPVNWNERQEKQHQQVRYSVRIGKKVIKLYNGSGISDTGCVKIYKEKSISLPGAFQLPLSIMQETIIPYDMTLSCRDTPDDFAWVSEYISTYLSEQMIAGRILHEYITDNSFDDVYLFCGKYACVEMIGKYKYEEIR